jgi:hypothetical protein
MSKAASRKTGHHRHHPEHQYKNIVLLGAAFIVVMLIAVGYRQHDAGMVAKVYEPLPPGDIRTEAVSDDLRAGACCAEGECLDLMREECNAEGYVFWPDADLCLTACQAIR